MMRTLLLLFIAISAAAQQDFSFDPYYGSPSGGDTIRFAALAAAIDFRAAVPEVLFGGNAATVTVVDSKTLTAVTSAHAEGAVDVLVRVAGATYTTFLNFGYALPREPLLVPLAVETPGAYGTRWTTDIWVYNDADEAVNLMPEVCFFIGAAFPCDEPIVVGAHASIRIPPRTQSVDSYFEAYLFPPDDVRSKLHFNVRIRNAANSDDLGTQIPIVPISQFRSRVVLTNVPVSDRVRGVLRVYDQQQQIAATPVVVSVYDATTGAFLTRRESGLRAGPTDTPLRFSNAFHDLLSDAAVRGHSTVRVEIEEEDASLWAMLTLTDNATQHVTVITSQ